MSNRAQLFRITSAPAGKMQKATNLFLRTLKRKQKERALWITSQKRVHRRKEKEFSSQVKRVKQMMRCRKIQRVCAERIAKCQARIK